MFTFNFFHKPTGMAQNATSSIGRLRNAIDAAGTQAARPNTAFQQAVSNRQMRDQLLGSLKKGGIVKKTGPYKLHKGERVIPAKRAKAMEKSKC